MCPPEAWRASKRRGARRGFLLMPRLLAIGGAHVDRIARLSGPHRPQTSNPASVTEDVGGGAFNALRAAKRLGVEAAIVSARGGDAAGERVEQAVESAGIVDLSAVHLDRATPSYTALLEPHGELVTAIADMDLYGFLLGRSFRRAPVQAWAETADAVLCDANLPVEGIMDVFTQLAKGRPVHALAISASKSERLKPFLHGLHGLYLNRHEAATMTGLHADCPVGEMAQALAALKTWRATISAGSGPLAVLEAGNIHLLDPPEIVVVDVTGAGDALAGTIIASLLNGESFLDAARNGVAAAALTASQPGACPDIALADITELAQRLKPARKWTP
jgi:pseudouridine kinase